MDNDQILRTLRQQAWQRAKGELNAVLQTFWNSVFDKHSKFNEMNDAVENFIKHVDDNGLAE